MSDSSNSKENAIICKFYNPYFGNGCKSGRNCKYKHLQEKQFIGYCTRVNKENRPSPQTRNTFRAAIDLLKKGKANQAVKKFEKIIKTCPYDELYNMWFARCHEELENFSEAEYYYRRSISIQPKFATAHGRYAEFSWHKLNNIPQANIHFQKSLFNKENHVTHRHYAQFIEQKFSDYKKSQYHFERCLELSPNDHGGHHSYAIVLQKMNADVNKIRYHYEQSIKLYDCANIHYSYALYLKNIKESNDALKHFTICISFENYNAMYHFQCGLFLYQSMNLIEKGLNHLNKACTIAPNDQVYRETYDKLKLNKSKKVYKKKVVTNNCNKNINGNNGKIITTNSNWGDTQNDNNNYKPEMELMETKCEFPQQKQECLSADSLCDDFSEYLQIDDGEKLENESKIHEIEFERFIKEKVALGAIGQFYVDRFNEKQINDIRLIEFIDYTFLKNNIRMNELHIRMMLKKIDEFKRDISSFSSWLQSLKLFDDYYAIFEMNGIITFELFYHYIKNIEDIVNMIGKHNLVDAMYLFQNTPKQNRQNVLGESSNYVM